MAETLYSIVVPVYKSEDSLRQLHERIDKTFENILGDYELILVDDCSSDNTVQLAKELGITVIIHEDNKGYGANQKTCYDDALKRNADIIVMLHPDYQYDPRAITAAADLLTADICDIIMGSRIRTRHEALTGGMPVYKYICNRILTTIENIFLGQNLGDFHSRNYRRNYL